MKKETQWIQKVTPTGENIFNRLKLLGISKAGLARSFGISPPLLRYRLFHVTHSIIGPLAAELRHRAALLVSLAEELEGLEK